MIIVWIWERSVWEYEWSRRVLQVEFESECMCMNTASIVYGLGFVFFIDCKYPCYPSGKCVSFVQMWSRQQSWERREGYLLPRDQWVLLSGGGGGVGSLAKGVLSCLIVCGPCRSWVAWWFWKRPWTDTGDAFVRKWRLLRELLGSCEISTTDSHSLRGENGFTYVFLIFKKLILECEWERE